MKGTGPDKAGKREAGGSLARLASPHASHNLGPMLRVESAVVAVDSGVWAGMPDSGGSGGHAAKLGP